MQLMQKRKLNYQCANFNPQTKREFISEHC